LKQQTGKVRLQEFIRRLDELEADMCEALEVVLFNDAKDRVAALARNI